MIVRPKPGVLDVLLAVRGSIVPHILWRLLAITLIATGAVLFAHYHPADLAHVAAIPFTLLGLSLSIFMGFRNNACYDRWWEGRKLWGQLTFEIRSFIRETQDLPLVRRQAMLRALCGFVHALGARLRERDERAALTPWLSIPTLAPNATDAALAHVGLQCLAALQAGEVGEIRYSLLEQRLAILSGVQGGCERIKFTPLPFAYSLLLHRTAYLFCLLLPFALANNLGWWTVPVVLVVSFTFFGLDALGDQLEDPFGNDKNDLPLSALTRNIERELRAALGEGDLPPPLLPENYLLT